MYIPIVFITDKNYLIQTATALESIKRNKDKNTSIKCYLLTTQDSAVDIGKLQLIKDKDFTIEPIIADENKLNKLPGAKEKYVAASKAALLKFSIPEVINEKKVIYLDGDIIVKKDLSDLINIDIENVYAAVVPDLPQVLYEKPLFDEGNGTHYFNTGVMLLNLEKLSKDNISNKLTKDKLSHADDLLMDQNSFNRVLGKNTRILPPTFNVTVASLIRSRAKYRLEDLNSLFGTNYKTIEEIIESAYVIHFSSKDKPWVFFDVPEADTWLNYFAKSIYSNLPLVRKSKLKKDINFKSIEVSKNDNKIPVVLSTNDKYVPNLIVTIDSILSNTKEKIDIKILHSGLNNSNIELIKAKLPSSNIELIDITNLLKENEKNLKTCGHFTTEMYYRWYIPEILYQYKKIIYLDCDLVIREDIGNLFNEDLNGKTFGAVINLQNKKKAKDRFAKLKTDHNNYINSGVLVIDNERFLKKDLKAKLFEFVRNNPKIDCPDQDALNAVALGDIKILNPLWNVQWHFQFISEQEKNNLCFSWDEYIENLKKAKIIHYTSNIKPWSNPQLPYANIFTEIFDKLGLKSQEVAKSETNSKSLSNQNIKDINKIISNIFSADGRNQIAIQRVCPEFNLLDYRSRLFIYAIKQKDIAAASAILIEIIDNDRNGIKQIYKEKIEKINNSISMKLTYPFRGFKNPTLKDAPIDGFSKYNLTDLKINDNCYELLRVLTAFFKETKVWTKGTSEYFSDYSKMNSLQKGFILSLRYADIQSAYIILQNLLNAKNYLLHYQYQFQIDLIYKTKSMKMTRPIRLLKRILTK